MPKVQVVLAADALMTSRYSLVPIPAKTPVRLPRRLSGSIPASSSACQVVSSKQSLLRVHHPGLKGGDAEEAVIEPVQVFKEPAPAENVLLGQPGRRPHLPTGPPTGRPSVIASLPFSSRSQKDSRSGAPGILAGHTHNGNGVLVSIDEAVPASAGTGLLPGIGWTSEPITGASSAAQVAGKGRDVGIVEDGGVRDHVVHRPGVRLRRLRSSTDIRESMPRSKNPTLQARGPWASAELPAIHLCRKRTSTLVPSLPSAWTLAGSGCLPCHWPMESWSTIVLAGAASSDKELRGHFLKISGQRRPVHRCHHTERQVLVHQFLEGPESLLRAEPACARCLQLPFDSSPAALRPRPALTRPPRLWSGPAGPAERR